MDSLFIIEPFLSLDDFMGIYILNITVLKKFKIKWNINLHQTLEAEELSRAQSLIKKTLNNQKPFITYEFWWTKNVFLSLIVPPPPMWPNPTPEKYYFDEFESTLSWLSLKLNLFKETFLWKRVFPIIPILLCKTFTSPHCALVLHPTNLNLHYLRILHTIYSFSDQSDSIIHM